MITLVLGGTRSGKSEVAERLAARLPGAVTYVATGLAEDPDMAARIALHQKRRAEMAWTTVEAGTDLPRVLESLPAAALVDSLGTWVARFADLDPDTDALCQALRARQAAGLSTVLVSEEVGLGVHAPTEAGRRFTDTLGALNRQVAELADEVLLVVAGRVLPLDRADGDR